MKLMFFVAFFLLMVTTVFGQDAKVILQQSYDKCQSVRNGYYELTKYRKSMTKKDTTTMSLNCYFKKLPEDTIFGSAFHTQVFRKDKYAGDVLYTGDDFVTTSLKDSSAEIMANSKWASEIKSYAHNYTFFNPLQKLKHSEMLHDSDLIDPMHIIKWIGEENINGTACYHIQANEFPEEDSTESMKLLRVEYQYWINKEDLIPIAYSLAVDIFMNHDTMYQYEKYILTHYDINYAFDENILTLNSIPAYYRIKDFVPYQSPKPLPKDTLAPNWELVSLKNEKMSLQDLYGNLVLIDFFYKSCYPCMKALPGLQAISDKYKDRGLHVIGLDPYDTKEDDLDSFLSKRGITYNVMMEAQDVAKEYRVSGYPTLFLIDKTGKIIFTQIGYSDDLDETLTALIEKNL